MNLYGYAAGDPTNFADPFGLCPDSVSTQQREECEKEEAAQREDAYQERLGVYNADARQAVVSTAVSIGFLGAGPYFASMRAMAGIRSGVVDGGTAGKFVLNSLVLGPSLVAGLHDVTAGGGSPSPLSGELGTAYRLARMTPFLGMGMQIGEALNSCSPVALRHPRE